jgi:hypothetical protein
MLLPETAPGKAIESVTNWNGAGSGTRTHDLLITSQLLYQLSYAGNKARDCKQSALRRQRVILHKMHFPSSSHPVCPLVHPRLHVNPLWSGPEPDKPSARHLPG